MAKIKFSLPIVGEDGNAFMIMGRFSRGARKAGWTADEVKEVLTECRSDDYDHLLATIMDYTEDN